MSNARTKFEMVDGPDLDKLLNHTALRDMMIKAFWKGLCHTDLSRRERIQITCDQFDTGNKNVQRIVLDI